jgi:hypothetical protein
MVVTVSTIDRQGVGMNFLKASRLYESLRQGSNKREVLSKIEDENSAQDFYRLLYPQKALLTKNGLASLFAEEVGVFIDVVMDVLGENDLALTLAQESNASTSQGWSVKDAFRMMESLSMNAVEVLDTAHKMDEIEARLFWSHVLANKPPITSRAFVIHLGISRGIHADVMKRHASLKDATELIHLIFQDPQGLDIPDRWYEEPNLALSPRRYLPFHPHDSMEKLEEFNYSRYQRIPNKGSTKMLYVIREQDGVRFVWRDRSGKIVSNGQAPDSSWLPDTPMILETVTDGNNIHVFDAIFPRYHTLTLEERLAKLQEHTKDTPIIVHQPTRIDSMVDLISSLKDDEAIRFPEIGEYKPLESGGYVMMSSLSKMILRLHSVRNIQDTLSVRLSCVDGYDDFIVVGEVDVVSDVKNTIRGMVDRLCTIMPSKDWEDIPDEIIIPIEAVVPSILKNPLSIPDALVVSARDDLGMSDVTQYVDFIHAS